MGRSERGPIDPPLDAAIEYLRTGEPPDQKFGTIVDVSFIPRPKEPQTSTPQLGAVRRLLRITGLT